MTQENPTACILATACAWTRVFVAVRRTGLCDGPTVAIRRRMTCRTLRRAAALSVVLAFIVMPSVAHANLFFGVDADGAFPTTGSNLLNGGGGFNVRIGSQTHLPALRVAGEVGYGYEHLFADRAPSDWSTHRVFAGARLGVGELLVPFVFGHFGYGWRDTPDSSFGGDGIALDGGAGLDLNLGIIAVGGHVGYAVIEAQPASPQWVIAGLDGTIVF